MVKIILTTPESLSVKRIENRPISSEDMDNSLMRAKIHEVM